MDFVYIFVLSRNRARCTQTRKTDDVQTPVSGLSNAHNQSFASDQMRAVRVSRVFQRVRFVALSDTEDVMAVWRHVGLNLKF